MGSAGAEELVAGEVVDGRWTLEKVLGAGGFGAVWLARGADGTSAAIKFLDPAVAVDTSTVRRFLEECAVLARLDHPGIAQTLGATKHRGRHALLMEYVPGRTLLHELAQRSTDGVPFEVNEACTLIADLLGALGYAHKNGIVHRDVKPANIIRRKKGASQIALLDFGVAKLLDAHPIDATTVGRVIGTMNYMAPEQFSGGTVSSATDTFAAGVILFELLTLRRLWIRDDQGQPARMLDRKWNADARNIYAAVMMRICKESRLSLTNYAAVPPWLDEVFRRAVAIDPAARFRSANDMASALLTEGRASVLSEAFLPPPMPAAALQAEAPPTVPDATAATMAMTALADTNSNGEAKAVVEELLPAIAPRPWDAADGGSFSDSKALPQIEARNPVAMAARALAELPEPRAAAEPWSAPTLPVALWHSKASNAGAAVRVGLLGVAALTGGSAGLLAPAYGALGAASGLVLGLGALSLLSTARRRRLVAAVSTSMTFVWRSKPQELEMGTQFIGVARPVARSRTKRDPDLTLTLLRRSMWLGGPDRFLVEVVVDGGTAAALRTLGVLENVASLGKVLAALTPEELRLSPRLVEEYAQNLARCGGTELRLDAATLSTELTFPAQSTRQTVADLHKACGFASALAVWCSTVGE